jgi:hypothetical protein
MGSRSVSSGHYVENGMRTTETSEMLPASLPIRERALSIALWALLRRVAFQFAGGRYRVQQAIQGADDD